MKYKFLLSAILTVLLPLSAAARDITVTGLVSEDSGEPLSGVAVQLKGSTAVYVITGADGSYSITVPSDGTLVFTCLGFQQEEVTVGSRSIINVVLKTDAQLLEDVIVVAYGTVRREAKTGAVTDINSDKITDKAATSIDKMLQGKLAGVSVSSASGQPGSNTIVRVRGTSSINAGNEPLWVIDGIPILNEDLRMSSSGIGEVVASATSFLNPNDVESISVLKDAAAASVYGSRAANGVILVTTKSGRAGKARISARVKFGAQKLANDNHIRPMTASELVGYWRDAAVNGGFNPDDPASPYYIPLSLKDQKTHDWYKDLTRVGLMQEYEISATGGSEKGTYFSSASYQDTDGIFYGVNFKRFSFRANADCQLTPTLKTGTRLSGSYLYNLGSLLTGDLQYKNPVFAMFRLFPWTPVKDSEGNYTFPSENGKFNPLANAAFDEMQDKQYHLNGNMFLEWKPTSKLTLKTTNGAELIHNISRSFENPAADIYGESSLESSSDDMICLTTSNTATYTDNFGSHHLHALLGQEATLSKANILGVVSPNVDPDIPYPNTSTPALDYGFSNIIEYSILSFFGILDYNYAGRYYLSASIRGDGSSRFGSRNKWGLFWSASASWNITSENFMAPTRDWLSNLKLRLSYGVNGNTDIGTYEAYGVYSPLSYNGAVTMVPYTPANNDLSWEKNKTWNVGLDFGFWHGRLSGSMDVYSRLTSDMLLQVKVPSTSGFNYAFRNAGSIRNTGIEFQAEGEIVRRNGWTWSVGINAAMNRSKVLDLAGSEFLTCSDQRNNQESSVRIVEGKSMYNFYLRDYAGVNPSTGEALFWTDDGELTPDQAKARYDYFGSPEPKLTGGLSSTLSWKGFSLDASLQFVCGNKVLASNSYLSDGETTLEENSSTEALNYWKKPGDTGCMPKPIAGGNNLWYSGFSTRFLQDGSYLRIKDITLSYSLPDKVLNAIKMKGVRVYVSAVNPYTFHNVSAFDPEFGEIGTSTCSYPMTKSFVGGLELTF